MQIYGLVANWMLASVLVTCMFCIIVVGSKEVDADLGLQLFKRVYSHFIQPICNRWDIGELGCFFSTFIHLRNWPSHPCHCYPFGRALEPPGYSKAMCLGPI